ncbi:MAG: hypothetical protein CFH42_00591 [Alphaproteobacteria bacterium MarineAlpha12_Bin1]|jgi:hypothetical protein|nr:MAG: hypothetical protein CFH42_00591 [Alphaproteobacteria bacterium MarineAlpha12_Bin1]|tara:strand:- start:34764 stop:35063 length:300 start_codon:yes stop_codon:yes gene_type:complete
MIKLTRMIGVLFVLTGSFIFLADIFDVLGSDSIFISLGEIWFQVNKSSLIISESFISRYIPLIGSWLWHPVISSILTIPAFLLFAVSGLIVLLFSRKQK